jgi:hypothetical protein
MFMTSLLMVELLALLLISLTVSLYQVARSFYNVVTAFTSGGSAVVALGDAADTGATVSATAYNNAAYALANLAKDSAGQPKICSATTCAPRIAITGAALTAGKIKVNYVYIQPSGK